MADGEEIKVILVDNEDNQIGIMEKNAAHMNGGKLHRSISIFVFNSDGQTMLQQRALSKYHAGGLWSNTCCSHPGPGESVETAAHRRLNEELGFDCEMNEVFTFIYKTPVGNGMTEHEFDHVFFGNYDADPVPNPDEVMDFKWIDVKELREDMKANPNNYTPWSILALKEVDKRKLV